MNRLLAKFCIDKLDIEDKTDKEIGDMIWDNLNAEIEKEFMHD